MALAIVAILALASWLYWPIFRDQSIQEAVLDGRNAPEWWPDSWRTEWAMRRKLLDPVTVRFAEIPIFDCRDFLHDYTQLEIRIDETACKELGITSDSLTKVLVNAIGLKSALLLWLDQHSLTFLIEGGELLITSKTAAASRRSRRSSPAMCLFTIHDLLDENVRVRREASFAAGINPPRDMSLRRAMIAALKDSDREVRVNAAFALSELSPPVSEAIPDLVRMRANDDATCRWAAMLAIRKIAPDSEAPNFQSLEHAAY
jgi:hypothetical protein